MPQTRFWFGLGLAYILLAIAESYFASQIETIDLPPIRKYAAGTQEQLDKFVKEVRGESPAHDALIRQVIIDWSQWLNFNNAVTGIETVAEKFNTGAKANRKLLYLAAASFVVAAIVSFMQGLSFI